MGPSHSESEEVGFDQGLIRPSASSTLTRRPPDEVSDGPVSCRIQGLQTTVPVRHIPGLFWLGNGISGISSYDRPLRQRRLDSPDAANGGHAFAFSIRTPSTVNEGGGSLVGQNLVTCASRC